MKAGGTAWPARESHSEGYGVAIDRYRQFFTQLGACKVGKNESHIVGGYFAGSSTENAGRASAGSVSPRNGDKA